MHLFYFNKLRLGLGLICFLNFGAQAADRDEQRAQENGIVSKFMSSCREFTRERIAGLYYTTSVTGHGSAEACMSEFIKRKMQDSWTLGKVVYSKKGPFFSQSDKGAYKAILRNAPVSSEVSLEPVLHNVIYQYFWKTIENTVNIIILPTVNHVYFASENREKNNACEVFIEKEEKERHLDSLALLINSLIEAEGKIERDLIKLKYNDYPYKELSSDEKDKKQKLLNEKMERLTNRKTELKKHRDSLDEEWKIKAKNYQMYLFSTPFISFSKEGFHPPFEEKFLRHLQEDYPQKIININTLIGNKESISRNLAGRLFSTVGNSGRYTIGHFMYGKVTINQEKTTMNVDIIDPTSDVDKSPIASSITSLFFDLGTPVSTQSFSFFTKLSQSFGLTLTHKFTYRGDQSLSNWHDCGRFSTIYLLIDVENQSILSLSNYTVYKGFKTLQSGGYDQIHQTKSEFNSIPDVHSWFSRYITGSVRGTCDYLLRNFFSTPHSTEIKNKEDQ